MSVTLNNARSIRAIKSILARHVHTVHNQEKDKAKTAAVTSTPLIWVEEYIARFVEGGEKPTCEYIDGELRPKPIAGREHSQVQTNIIRYVALNNEEQFEALPELSTRLREAKFYVPDIAVEESARSIQGRYPGPKDPIFLCIEIKSPDHRIGKLFGKCGEYHAWGVPYC